MIMLRGRGRSRGPASTRVLARARLLNAAAGRGGARQGAAMTATSLPSLTTGQTSSSSGNDPRQSEDQSTSETNHLASGANGDGGENVTCTISNVYEICKGVMGQLKVIDGQLKKIEDKQIKLSDTVKELNDMIKKNYKRIVCYQKDSS